ncbi:cation/H(+) antiporter 27-like [Tripterygium wilfordii]|uniref:Cation/H(+) antiporter 27-like n=2 Tax=Tripterygium wilfordii TaxID=458696 RepID=A0A7J7DWM3_TRIWF|nr:cation/H(+) antiporter 27-like [Tripterygium wilfordii]
MNSSSFTANVTLGTRNVTIFCEPFTKLGKYSLGEDLTHFPLQLLMLQVGLVTTVTIFLQFFLQPFGQPSFVPQVLGGIAVGPSFLARDERYKRKFFSPRSEIVLDVCEAMGFTFFVFLLSVRLDLTILKKCGNLAVLIGFTSFIFPLIITLFAAHLLRRIVQLDEEVQKSLTIIATLVSTTSFHVVLHLLTDLNLLNSELGRLALSSSMISGFVSGIFLIITLALKDALETSATSMLLMQLTKVSMILISVFILRRIMLWMMRRTPDGKPLKESYTIAINIMVLVFSLWGEYTGQHYFVGPIILGLATPEGPPMGSSLSDKIGCFVSAVLMPCYTINLGRRVDTFLVSFQNFAVIEFLFVISSTVKFAAVMIPSVLYYNMPFLDGLALGFLLNCKGLVDIQIFERARQVKGVDTEVFSIIVFSALFQSAILTPLVKAVYDPSRRYVAYTRRTIQHCKRNTELRIIACIHEQENVPTLITILEASNPTRENPIGVYVLNLEGLVGTALPLLIQHNYESSSQPHKQTKTHHIFNAFRQYEFRNQGLVMVQCFTAIAPSTTMHEDVCSMALEKCASLVIIPFQTYDSPTIRTLNKMVLQKAPCSVCILFDRGQFGESRSTFTAQLTTNVCIIYLGGPDDHETLAFGARMAEHPSVRLTVLRLVAIRPHSGDLFEKRRDSNIINDFRISNRDNDNVEYREESVTEGADTARLLRSWGYNDYDLVMVGRRHDNDSPLLSGLSMWSEIEELGVVGDLLASSDSQCTASVLIVQQQASVVQEMLQSSKHTVRTP